MENVHRFQPFAQVTLDITIRVLRIFYRISDDDLTSTEDKDTDAVDVGGTGKVDDELDAGLYERLRRFPAPHLTKYGHCGRKKKAFAASDPRSFEVTDDGDNIDSFTYPQMAQLDDHRRLMFDHVRDILFTGALVERASLANSGQQGAHSGLAATMRAIAEERSKPNGVACDTVQHMPTNTAANLGRLPQQGWSSRKARDMASPTKEALESFVVYGI